MVSINSDEDYSWFDTYPTKKASEDYLPFIFVGIFFGSIIATLIINAILDKTKNYRNCGLQIKNFLQRKNQEGTIIINIIYVNIWMPTKKLLSRSNSMESVSTREGYEEV